MSRKRSSTKRELPEPVFFVDADLSDAHFVNTLPAILRFLGRHPRPWIAKLYRPTNLPQGGEALPGEIKMWLTLQAWLKGR